jgi:hypothetical protein
MLFRGYLESNIAGILQGRGVHVTGVSAAYTFKLNNFFLNNFIQLSLY